MRDIYIITCRLDRKYKFPKEELKQLLKRFDVELIRIERVRWR